MITSTGGSLGCAVRASVKRSLAPSKSRLRNVSIAAATFLYCCDSGLSTASPISVFTFNGCAGLLGRSVAAVQFLARGQRVPAADNHESR